MTNNPTSGYLPLEHFQETDDDHSTSRIRDIPYGKPRESLVIYPTEVVFAETSVGMASVPYPVMVTNDGYDIVVISEIKTVGNFSCAGTITNLNPGEHAWLYVTFLPRHEGFMTGGIYLNSGGASGEEFIPLSGVGGVGLGWYYKTRDAFVIKVAEGFSPPPGLVVDAGGLSYISSPGSTAIPDLPGFLPFGIIYPQHFNVKGTGLIDDTLTFDAANVYAAAAKGLLHIPAGTYLVSKLVFYADTLIRTSKNAIIRSKGTAEPPNFIFEIGDRVDFDTLIFTIPGNETATFILSIGQTVRGKLLRLIADKPHPSSGINILGSGVKIDRVEINNIDNAFNINNTTPALLTSIDIGFIDITCYRRAVYLTNCSGRIDGLRCSIRTPTVQAALSGPGQNGVLIGGCQNFIFGDLWIENSGEHSVRLGGAYPGGPSTKNIKFGNITSIRNRGCVFKINPTLLVAPGITETADNIQVGNIMAIDASDSRNAGNSEVLRLTHCRNVQIGDVLAIKHELSFSGQSALRINDARNVHIASLGGPCNAGLVDIDWKSDTNDYLEDTSKHTQYSGDIIGLYIDRLHGPSPGETGGGNAIGVELGPRNIGDVHINCDNVTGFENVVYWATGTLVDVFRVTGWVDGPTAPSYVNPPNSDNFQVDLSWNNTRQQGRPYNMAPGIGVHQWTMPGTTYGEIIPKGLFLNSSQTEAAMDSYGGAVEFSRLESGRRGGAIALKQTNIEGYQTGIAVWVGGNHIATNVVNEHTVFKHNGSLQLKMLPRVADNAAALAAGLVIGDTYKTATGELRIVV